MGNTTQNDATAVLGEDCPHGGGYDFFHERTGLAIFLMYVLSIVIIPAVGLALNTTKFRLMGTALRHGPAVPPAPPGVTAPSWYPNCSIHGQILPILPMDGAVYWGWNVACGMMMA